MRFYKNQKDDLHCFQATLLMVLSIYFPKEKFTYNQIDKITGYKKGQYTQDSQGLLWLAKKGFNFVRITDFDEKRFVKEGEKYLKWYWRPDVYERNKKEMDFKKMRKLSRALMPYTTFITKLPTSRNVETLFNSGRTVVVHLNPYVIQRRKGYTSHAVLVVKITKNFVYIHNPGLPPKKNQKVSKKLFAKALHEIVGIRKIG